jgi:putative ABC transport system permease protein
MSASPVRRAIRGGLRRRHVQTLVIGVVLLVSTTASVLALGLIVASSAPFDHAFAAQRGAHLDVVINPARVTTGELAATTRLPQVTAAAGPFSVVTITPSQGGYPLGPLTVSGRANPGGPVDDVTLQAGHWATAPGQLVLASDPAPGENAYLPLGAKISVTGKRGSPLLTVVGLANSVTSTAGAWVLPGEMAALRATGAPAGEQMLYRFRSAGTAVQVHSDLAAVAAALPRGAIAGSQSYLTVKSQQSQSVGPFVPFLVAFGIIGLVLSVLIVTNVVSGAVVAGYRRIGILKSIGFTPGQVIAAYAGQVSVPSVVGCLGGVVLGNVLAQPLLHKTAEVYAAGSLRVPAWVDVFVAVGMLAVVGVAALLPAARAGRMGAVQAIAAGRAPAQGRGYAAHRLLGKLRLPRPVTVGLAAPFARPARAAATLVAILLGATAATFAIGLSSTLSRVVVSLSRDRAEPVQVYPNRPTFGPAGQRAVVAALRAQPGTLRFVAEADNAATVTGLSQQVGVTAFAGNAAWTGYDMISGRWYSRTGEADAATGFLNTTGKAVGDTVTVALGRTPITVRIVGQVFDSDNSGADLITSTRTLAAAGPAFADPSEYDVGLRPGTSPAAYARAINRTLGHAYSAELNNSNSTIIHLMDVIIGMLTMMLAVVAGLGVLNIVVMLTRERVHDIGVFKAIGMTPWQTIGMVVCWVAGTGLVAGVLAVPLGIELHHRVVPAMAAAANLGVPASMLNVFGGWEMALLALAGLAIAVLGAMLPASWAAGTRTATALRAE